MPPGRQVSSQRLPRDGLQRHHADVGTGLSGPSGATRGVREESAGRSRVVGPSQLGGRIGGSSRGV